MQRTGLPESKSPELRMAIALRDKANDIAKVKIHKPHWMVRDEARKIRRRFKHLANLTTKQRSYREKGRQALLTIQRVLVERQKRQAELLKGLQQKEQKTETGIVLPSGRQVAEVLTGARGEGN